MQSNIEYTENQDGTVTAVVYDENNEVVSTETFHSPYYDPQRVIISHLLSGEETEEET